MVVDITVSVAHVHDAVDGSGITALGPLKREEPALAADRIWVVALKDSESAIPCQTQCR